MTGPLLRGLARVLLVEQLDVESEDAVVESECG
jgi:hypothetical protein